MVEHLLKMGANPNTRTQLSESMLQIANGETFYDIATLLVDYGANINAKDVFGNTLLHNLISDSKDTNELKSQIKWALDNGASVNACNRACKTPLMNSREHNKQKAMGTLLSYDKTNIDTRDVFGRMALTYATKLRTSVPVEMLLEKGANPNNRTIKLQTPLMSAVNGHFSRNHSWSNIDITKSLIRNGAKINARDIQGRTALMHACMSPQKDSKIAEFLIRIGANLDIKHRFKNKTASDYAKENGRFDIADLINKNLNRSHKKRNQCEMNLSM